MSRELESKTDMDDVDDDPAHRPVCRNPTRGGVFMSENREWSFSLDEKMQ